MRSFWPAAEAAQSDYEVLRESVLAGGQAFSMAAGRFERRGLAGLIAWPAAEPILVARLAGANRPAWTPHADPRVEVLAAGYELLLAAPDELSTTKEAQR